MMIKLTLSLALALTLTACEEKKNPPPATAESGEKAGNVGGTYKFGNDVEEGAVGSVMVYPQTDNSALFYLDVCRGAPSYNSGTIFGRMAIKDNIGTYTEINDDYDCILKFKFASQQLEIATEAEHNNCGFGGNVEADNTYKLTDKSIPQYYSDPEDRKVFFEEEARHMLNIGAKQ